MQYSFSSISRYSDASGKPSNFELLDTNLFGQIERRFLVGLVVHHVLEVELKEFLSAEVNKIKIGNQQLFDRAEQVLAECLQSDDQHYREVKNKVNKYLRMGKQMLLCNCRGYTIHSVEDYFSMSIDSEIEIVAKPDIVLTCEGQKMRIVDWKTQSIARSRTDDEQMSIYKMVLEHNFQDYEIESYTAYLSMGRWSQNWHTEGYRNELIQDIISHHNKS